MEYESIAFNWDKLVKHYLLVAVVQLDDDVIPH